MDSDITLEHRHSHAVLLTGGTAEARFSLARRLAAGVLCRGRAPDEEGYGAPCGICISCRKVEGGWHPDLTFLRPDGREIRVDAVRALRRDLFLAPGESERRVVVIEEADTLNLHAQNALLSVLEEGPAVFFLLCETPSALLSTVRSRCETRRLGDTPESSGTRDDVDKLTEAVAAGDAWTVLRRCYALEKMKRDEFDVFLDVLAETLFQKMLSAKTWTCPDPSLKPTNLFDTQVFPLTAAQISHIIDEIRRIQKRLTQNAAVSQQSGRLAVLLESSLTPRAPSPT